MTNSDATGKPDILSIDMETETRRVYKNISKVKGRMVPIIDWKITLFINGIKLEEDEVFVPEEFFDSLRAPGKYPMFTCTCGIFGCGGYEVEVIHEDKHVVWITEQSPFADPSVISTNTFIFSWEQIIAFSEELVRKFEELKGMMNMNQIDFFFEDARYKEIINKLKSDKLS
ncbi:hypothetical protein [Paenibacillus sp. NFR01]|uniref:hypothetical protein n=1 Tax=Paenibacillus sp. NFR01 TaxID=1566279 RepID=UPI0008B7FBF1|nr:hypothetical protein [Paenibacillus sp. NFR01]SEU19702.1 hypothetical protein SAMN03159358_3907 [Paenibacillus sp. NFR01]